MVNKENLSEFVAKFENENGELAIVALSMQDYEALALNISELKRFINQQTEIIVYYEDAMKPKEEPETSKD